MANFIYKPKTITLFIVGYYGFKNFGDEWLLENILKELNHGPNPVDITLLHARSSPNTVHRFDVVKLIKTIKKSDLVIFGGGSLFQSLSSKASFYYYYLILILSNFFCKQVLLFAQGLGPLSNFEKRILTKATQKCLITFRDDQSAAMLGRQSEYEQDKTFDYCFLQHKSRRFKHNLMIISWIIKASKKDEVLIRNIIKKLVSLNYSLIFFSSNNIDHAFIQKLVKDLGFNTPIQRLSLKLSLPQGLVVTSRYHGGVLALSQGVPIITFGEDPKCQNLALQHQSVHLKHLDDLGGVIKQIQYKFEKPFRCQRTLFEKKWQQSRASHNKVLYQALVALYEQKKRQNNVDDFLRITFWTGDLKQLSRTVKNEMLQKKGLTRILSLNPEIWMRSLRKDAPSLEAEYILPDGIGLCLGYQFLKNKALPKRAGSELILTLLNEGECSIFLLGSDEKSNQKAQKLIQEKYPEVTILGGQHGFFNSTEEGQIKEKIRKLPACFIFCGLGYPKQEAFIQKMKQDQDVRDHNKVIIACGGMIDVLSEQKPFAPKRWRMLGLEWLYSGLKQPHRILRWHYHLNFIFKVICIKVIKSVKK